jgi:predicted Zn-dependent protease with MMP-like domain
MVRKQTGKGWAAVVSGRARRRQSFHALVARVLDELPEEFRHRLENVEVVVEDEGAPGTLGLYHGIPSTERNASYSGVLPDVITIYRRPIEARAQNREELAREVRRTVLHEIAHYFGISDERLREIDRY